jgi:hypothetical protein
MRSADASNQDESNSRKPVLYWLDAIEATRRRRHSSELGQPNAPEHENVLHQRPDMAMVKTQWKSEAELRNMQAADQARQSMTDQGPVGKQSR